MLPKKQNQVPCIVIFELQNSVKYLRWSVFARVVNGFQLLTIFVKHSILDIWHGSEYSSVAYIFRFFKREPTQPALTCSKLTREELEQVVKYVQS